MAFILEIYNLPILIFFLEILVYVENLWYEVIWSRWQPSRTTTLDKLIMHKEDEIWHAMIYGNNGDVRKIFEDLTNTPEEQRNQKLDMVNTFQQITVLQQAVLKGDCDLVWNILENSSFTSPEKYINSGDYRSRTALHNLVCASVRPLSPPDSVELDDTLKIFGLLSEYGANVNALDGSFMTPLHSLLSAALGLKFWTDMGREYTPLIPLLDSLLLAGAEVQTKDKKGNSPLHIACELQNHEAIEKLVLHGADPETLNRDRRTSRRIFHDMQGADKDFWRRMTILSLERQNVGADVYAPSRKLSQSRDRITKARMAVCEKSPVHLQYQENDSATESSNPLHWMAGDISVSEVLYSENLSMGTTFLAKCDKECQCACNDLFQRPREVDHTAEDNLEQGSTAMKSTAADSSVTLAKDVWRWVNFPANNDTACLYYNLTVTLFNAGLEVSGGLLQTLFTEIVKELLPAVEEAGKDEAAKIYGGTYSDTKTNSTLTLSVDDEPGFRITNWTVRGVDIAGTYLSIGLPPTFPTPPGEVRFRLYPTGLKSDTESSWRMMFTAGSEEDNEEANALLAWPDGNCNTWASLDRIVYQLLSHDHFVFTESGRGSDRKAEKLELVGYRVELQRDD
ncbi:beta-lactamase 2 [Fusarium subglutinans]|uniref:Beta-lactamase 2 n=1 Tax=Gibberella subglutinans TaxID=42677 RepID=A0A8H5QEC7_GIBSU|nr:beta-lactamase 2 [Fusarium subglutinans]KAF5613722.1 beta-lactamase 2 [Fusarium subglutinans]